MSTLKHKIKKTIDDVAGVAKKATSNIVDGAKSAEKKVEKAGKRARKA